MLHNSVCIDRAAAAYRVPTAQIERLIDSGHEPGDVGVMGIPPKWLPILAHVGFKPAEVVESQCSNIAAGAWIISYEAIIGNNIEPNDTRKPKAPPFIKSAAGLSNSCIEAAAKKYHLSATLFRGVLATEGGRTGQIHWNTNGSYDIGPAQINSIWLSPLAKQGITRDMVLNDGCLNVTIGAWILSQKLIGANPAQPAQFWRHVGDYNSATPAYNARYVQLVWKNIVAANQPDDASQDRNWIR